MSHNFRHMRTNSILSSKIAYRFQADIFDNYFMKKEKSFPRGTYFRRVC